MEYKQVAQGGAGRTDNNWLKHSSASDQAKVPPLSQLLLPYAHTGQHRGRTQIGVAPTRTQVSAHRQSTQGLLDAALVPPVHLCAYTRACKHTYKHASTQAHTSTHTST